MVAVGHTADDLAETVLLHVARGSGLHGLRGMSELDPWPYPASQDGHDAPAADLKVWRPLIELTRHHTISYCRNYGIDYRDDSTNYMREFARNRVRLDIMPALKEQLNPRIVDALGRLSRTAAAQVDYMEQQADLLWPQVASEPIADDGSLRLDRNALAETHPALRHIILRRAWVTVTGHEHRLTERHLKAMSDAASNPGSGKIIQLPRGFRFAVDARRATLSGPGQGRRLSVPRACTRVPAHPAMGTHRRRRHPARRLGGYCPIRACPTRYFPGHGQPAVCVPVIRGAGGRRNRAHLATRRPYATVGCDRHPQASGHFH